MRYYIIAGEASGDLHGSNLIHALKKQDSRAEIRAWGGDLMQSAGANVVKHYKDLAFIWHPMLAILHYTPTSFAKDEFFSKSCFKDI